MQLTSSFFKKRQVDKLSDLFDVKKGNRESYRDFRQKIVSAVDYYYSRQNEKPQQDNIAKLDKPINEYAYHIIGYDDVLINHMAEKSIQLNTLPIGTRKNAEELLTTEIMKKYPPQTFVDANGNIWQIII